MYIMYEIKLKIDLEFLKSYRNRIIDTIINEDSSVVYDVMVTKLFHYFIKNSDYSIEKLINLYNIHQTEFLELNLKDGTVLLDNPIVDKDLFPDSF